MSADEKCVHDLDTLNGKASAFPKHENSMPPLNPDVADLAPSVPELTPYDHDHAITAAREQTFRDRRFAWRVPTAGIVLRTYANMDGTGFKLPSPHVPPETSVPPRRPPVRYGLGKERASPRR